MIKNDTVEMLVEQARRAEAEGKTDLAVDLFGRAAAITCSPDLDLWYGIRLSALGRVNAAVAALERAWAMAPGRPDIGFHLAHALRDQPDRAQVVLEDLIATGSADFNVHVALIQLLERSNQASAMSSALMRSEDMLANNIDFAVFAGGQWMSSGAFDLAMKSFVRGFRLSAFQPALVYEAAARAVQESEGEQPTELIQILHSSIGRNNFSEATCGTIRDAVICYSANKAWQYFVDPQANNCLSPDLIDMLGNTPSDDLRQIFAARSYEIREARTDEADRIAEQIGRRLADPFALRKSGFDFDIWFEKHLDLQKHHRSESVLFQRTALSDAAFQLQKDMLKDGQLSLVSPLDGLSHQSRCGFVLEYLRDRGIPHAGSGAAYFMSSGEPAFVMFSGEENWPMAWFYPRLTLLVRERGFIESDRHLIPNIVDLQAIIVKRLASSLEYCYGSPSQRKSLAIFGSNDFISTHLFEDISGFDRLVQVGSAALVRDVLISSAEPYGRFEELFPEFVSNCTIHRPHIPDCLAYNKLVQDLDMFPVRVAGGFATKGSADRVLGQARQSGSSEWNARLQQLRSKQFPIVAVNLRIRRRSWTVKPAEIAAMLDGFVEKYPLAAFLFDGSVLLSAFDTLDSTMLAERKLADEIASRMKSRAPRVVVVGVRLSDAINATQLADMHLSIQGTSTTRSVLISNKPGIVIGPAQFWWDVRNYRKSCTRQLDLRNFSVDGTSGNMSEVDFACNPAIVLEALLSTAGEL